MHHTHTPIPLAVLRDGRRGTIVDRYDSDEFGEDVLFEVAFGDGTNGVETETIPAGDVYVFDVGGPAPRLTWRPVAAEIDGGPGWRLNMRIHVHTLAEYFSAGIAGRPGHSPVVPGAFPPRDCVEGAIIHAEMLGLHEVHLYFDVSIDRDAALGGWSDLVPGMERLALPPREVVDVETERTTEDRAVPIPVPTINPDFDQLAAVELALSGVHPDWVNPELEDALLAVDPKAWAESVLSVGDALRALRYCAPEEIRVVVLGQDPYPKPGKACGLSFGLSDEWIARNGEECVDGSTFGNILREVEASAGATPEDWTLESWARRGVLLLNTQLSVAPGAPKSHVGLGWDAVVEAILLQVPRDAVWLAFGADARTTALRYTSPTQVVATSHPTKYSATRGSQYAPAFVGSKCFSAVDAKLKEVGRDPINWVSDAREVPIPEDEVLSA